MTGRRVSVLQGRLCGLFFVLAAAVVTAGCGEAPAPAQAARDVKAEASGYADAVNAARRYDPAQLARGGVLFARHCAGCHGARGEGTVMPWNVRGPGGLWPPPPLDDSAHAWHHSTAALAQAIRSGSPPGEGNMPAWEGKLTPEQIADLVVWITSLWSEEIYTTWFEQVEAPVRRGEIVR